MAESHHLSITKGQSTPRAKEHGYNYSHAKKETLRYSYTVMWWLNVHSSYFSFSDAELIAVAGTSVRPVMSSSRGLTFLLVCNYHTNFFFFETIKGSHKASETVRHKRAAPVVHFTEASSPYSWLNQCHTYTLKTQWLLPCRISYVAGFIFLCSK